jgi:HlyD family secretion protein
MKRWIFRLAVLALLVAAVPVLRATVLRPDPVEVRVVAVEAGDVESTVTNTRAGTLEARRRAALSTAVGGRVLALPVAEGDTVAEGDLLLRLDDGVARARTTLAARRVESAEARLAETCLVAARIDQEHARRRELAERGVVSADELDEVESRRDRAHAACDIARAGVEEARAELALGREELALHELRAPFGGVIARLEAELGEFVTPSPTGVQLPAVVDLFDPTSLRVTAPMDEVDAARLSVGQRVRVTVDSFPGRAFTGTLERIAPFVLDLERQNRTVEVEVRLEEDGELPAMLPGTSADVEVILEVAEAVLRIPTAALLEGGRVLVLEDGLLVERRVETGLSNWNFTEVRSGLAAGERVVTSLGSEAVRAGAAAVVAGEAAPAP